MCATSTIWDGTRTIEVHEHVKPNGTVIHSASIVPGRYLRVKQGNIPWVYLGGSLVKALTKALEDGTAISIEPTEDGYCRLEIHREYTAMATVLDPKRGYLPIRQEMIAQGELRRCEEIEFEAVDPSVWFPIAVWTQSASWRKPPSEQPVPRLRFTNIRINDPNFDRLLAPLLPNGSTVADEVRRVRYVVDHKSGLNIAGKASSSLDPGAAAPGAFETVYSLDANQALKRIAPPSPAARRQFTINSEPHQDQVPEAALRTTIYVFQWDDAVKPKVCYTGTGFLKLSEILQYACELDIVEYSGPENLLDLRLAGDWIVRRDASRAERLQALERIVYEETGITITFEKRRIDTPVVRATGIFRYHRLPGALGENNVQLFAEASDDQLRTRAGGGSGTLAQLLRHVTDRTGKRFVDDTLSSDMDVSWSDYESSKLTAHRQFRQKYRYDLALLLENVTRQTGLTFTTERRKINEWLLRIKP